MLFHALILLNVTGDLFDYVSDHIFISATPLSRKLLLIVWLVLISHVT